jgi:hypothetical protein
MMRFALLALLLLASSALPQTNRDLENERAEADRVAAAQAKAASKGAVQPPRITPKAAPKEDYVNLQLGDAEDKVNVKIIQGPDDAIMLAKLDCESQKPFHRPFFRYIWIDSGEAQDAQAVSLTVNIPGRGVTIQRPLPLGKEKIMVVRIDLRHYAPRPTDLREWIDTWEELQFDPRFNLLITKGTLKFAVDRFPDFKARGFIAGFKEVETEETKKVAPYTGPDGYQYNTKKVKVKTQQRVNRIEEVSVANLKDVELIRLPSPSLNQKALQDLMQMTGSQAPIVSHKYMIGRMLSQIQDKGVFTQIYGGLYYRFAGIPKKGAKGTDEDALFQKLGIGNVDGGLTAEKLFNDLRTDRRAAKFRSDVTGRPRRIDFFRSLVVGLDSGQSLISVTHDIKAEHIDIDTHPMLNLLNFRDDAREVIYEQSNGLHGYALFNGEGERADEVPPDVARDHTIPAPHNGRLQPAISCIACHEADGSDGWKKTGNDVTLLMKGRRLDVFGDTSVKDADVADTNARLVGLYRADPERFLSKGRDDYAVNVYRATGTWGGWKASAENASAANIVKNAAGSIVSNWRAYFYDLVDARQALRELGIEANAADSLKVLNTILVPDLRAVVPVPEIGETIVPEDPRLAALKAGLSITRYDWDLVYAFALERTRVYLGKLKIDKKKDNKKSVPVED